MILSLALGLALIQQPAFRTDTTVTVQSGTRLDLELAVGGVTIRTWDRNQVRLRAHHSARTSLDIRHDGGVLRVEAEGRMGMAGDVELELSVPVGMSVDVEGLTVDVDAEGMRGLLRVESMDGDMMVRDASELRLESMNGRITVAGARGRVSLSSVSRDIVASGLSGEVTAESVSGSIWLTGIESSRVVAETLSGRVVFEGSVRPGGSYTLASHSGPLTLAMPEGANATVSVSQASGRLTGTFALPATDARSRRRQTLRFGNGGASVELESFSGPIRLVRPHELPARTERPDRNDEDASTADSWSHGGDIAADILEGLDLGSLSGLAGLANLGAGMGREVVGELGHEFRRGIWRDLVPDIRLDLDLRHARKARDRSPDRLEQ